MKILNYKNHNAHQIANEIKAAEKDFIEANCKEMELADIAKFTIDRWSKLNAKAGKDPEKRRVLKHLYTALAYMGYPNALSYLEMLASYDAKDAENLSDAQALNQAKEEEGFWQTVNFLASNDEEENISLAYALLFGLGCDKDFDRARVIYKKKLFEKYDTLDEAQRNKLRDARDGKLSCNMPEIRKRTITAILNRDLDELDRVFNEAVEKGAEHDFHSVHGMMCYIDKIR